MNAWPEAALSEVLADSAPGFACGEDVEDGVFQFRMNNITTEGHLDLSKRRRVPRDYRNIDRFLMRPGDVLFNATNSPDLVGKTAFFPGLDEPAVFSNHFLRLRPRDGAIDGRYLTRWLNLQFAHGRFKGMCRQWVNQATVSRDALLSLNVPIPPLPEQRRIAEILDKADALRAMRRAALAQLDTLTQSIFLDALGDLARWPTCTLSELCDDDAPITYGILQPGPNVVDGVPYIRPTEIHAGRIDVQALRKTSAEIAKRYRKSSLKSGDILITIVGTIGKVAVVPSQLDGANITQSSARVRVHEDKADRRFVELFLRSHAAKQQFDQDRLGVAVERLNLHHVRDLEVPTPPVSVQKVVAAKVMCVERLHLSMRRSLDAADSLFTSLQHRVFRGGLQE